jgi:hypothetical protein
MERSKQTSEQTKMRCDKNYITQKTSGLWTNNINKFKSVTINMIERKGSDCKYVEIFTDHVGSIGAPSRRTVFIRGTNTKQWEHQTMRSP